MSFHPITTTLPAAATWNESGPGRYMKSTVTFGNPADYIQIAPGVRNSKLKRTNAAVSRLFQKDVTVTQPGEAPVVQRRSASVQLVMQIDDGFTSTEIDNMIATINEFVAVAALDRILNGER